MAICAPQINYQGLHCHTVNLFPEYQFEMVEITECYFLPIMKRRMTCALMMETMKKEYKLNFQKNS